MMYGLCLLVISAQTVLVFPQSQIPVQDGDSGEKSYSQTRQLFQYAPDDHGAQDTPVPAPAQRNQDLAPAQRDQDPASAQIDQDLAPAHRNQDPASASRTGQTSPLVSASSGTKDAQGQGQGDVIPDGESAAQHGHSEVPESGVQGGDPRSSSLTSGGLHHDPNAQFPEGSADDGEGPSDEMRGVAKAGFPSQHDEGFRGRTPASASRVKSVAQAPVPQSYRGDVKSYPAMKVEEKPAYNTNSPALSDGNIHNPENPFERMKSEVEATSADGGSGGLITDTDSAVDHSPPLSHSGQNSAGRMSDTGVSVEGAVKSATAVPEYAPRNRRPDTNSRSQNTAGNEVSANSRYGIKDAKKAFRSERRSSVESRPYSQTVPENEEAESNATDSDKLAKPDVPNKTRTSHSHGDALQKKADDSGDGGVAYSGSNDHASSQDDETQDDSNTSIQASTNASTDNHANHLHPNASFLEVMTEAASPEHPTEDLRPRWHAVIITLLAGTLTVLVFILVLITRRHWSRRHARESREIREAQQPTTPQPPPSPLPSLKAKGVSAPVENKPPKRAMSFQKSEITSAKSPQEVSVASDSTSGSSDTEASA